MGREQGEPMRVLTQGLLDANPTLVAIALVGLAVVTLIYLVRRRSRR